MMLSLGMFHRKDSKYNEDIAYKYYPNKGNCFAASNEFFNQSEPENNYNIIAKYGFKNVK